MQISKMQTYLSDKMSYEPKKIAQKIYLVLVLDKKSGFWFFKKIFFHS
jgi:hypothetical protein